MNGDSVKHHYVPQSILRRFSLDATQKQLYIFDKARSKTFMSSIRDAGCENYFNTVEVQGQTVCFENLFQTNDDQLAHLLDCITTNRSLALLTPQDRVALSEVIAAQIVRTKMLRTTIHSIAEQLSTSLGKAGFDPGKVDGFAIPTEQEVRQAALASLRDLGGIIGALQTKRPILIHTLDSRPFWISDNPVVMHNTFPYGERALSSPGIEIYFPISCELVLGFFCPSIEQRMRELLALEHPQFDKEKYTKIYQGFQDGNSVSLGSNTLSFLNSLQVLYSSRFIYGPNNDFEYACEILKRHPEARDKQTLVSIGSIGEGLPRRQRMPSGLWVVIYGGRSHHLIKVESWDENSEFLDFKTCDLLILRAILEDQPLEQATLFEDGWERRGMRKVRIEVMEPSASSRVRISHSDEALNQIMRSERKRHPTGA